MKNRRETELIQLAFGELKEPEAGRLRASIPDGSVDSVFMMEMAALREDLKLLDVPEHQLSTERMRDAILNEGLHPSRVSSKPQWLKLVWAPALTLLVAYVVTTSVRNQPSGDPLLTMGAPEQSTPMNIFAEPLGTDGSSDSIAGAASAPDVSGESTVSVPVRSVRSGSRSRYAIANRSMKREGLSPSPDAGATLVANTIVMTAGTAPANDVESIAHKGIAPDAAPVEQPGIVLIGNDRDAQTGANKAIEVSSTSNVVIGG